MTWVLSEFRTGQLVQVRSKEEILATLDENGCLDDMPFMPEMLNYCGQTVRVSAVAHKTCETARRTYKARRLDRTVHLEGLRCDGSAHGGCQAACNIFWKDAWLKPASERSARAGKSTPRGQRDRCDEERLLALTRRTSEAGDAPIRYACQATNIIEATQPLAWWEPRQYFLDVITGNHSVGHVLAVLWLAFLKDISRHLPFGYRLLARLREFSHRVLMGREVPEFEGLVPAGQLTPTGRLDLQPGERVRIKTKREIGETLDSKGKNRGMTYDVEMGQYCGQIATVHSSVTKIIDEYTGEMQQMKQPCIILDGVVCTSQYSHCRLMCPRAITPYWREVWLERAQAEVPALAGAPKPAAASAGGSSR